MSKQQKLELTWIGKGNRPKLEPRILFEDPEKSYYSRHKVTDKGVFDNRLIFLDNLLALKAAQLTCRFTPWRQDSASECRILPSPFKKRLTQRAGEVSKEEKL